MEFPTRDDIVRNARKLFPSILFAISMNVAILMMLGRNPFETYQHVDARITQAEQLCDFYRPKNKTGWPEEWEHKPTPPGSIPCDAARERELYRQSEFPVKRYYVLFVDYVSPADAKTHSQRIQILAERLPGDMNPGMTIKLFASTTDPYSVRVE